MDKGKTKKITQFFSKNVSKAGSGGGGSKKHGGGGSKGSTKDEKEAPPKRGKKEESIEKIIVEDSPPKLETSSKQIKKEKCAGDEKAMVSDMFLVNCEKYRSSKYLEAALRSFFAGIEEKELFAMLHIFRMEVTHVITTNYYQVELSFSTALTYVAICRKESLFLCMGDMIYQCKADWMAKKWVNSSEEIPTILIESD